MFSRPPVFKFKPVNYLFRDDFDGPAGTSPDPSKWSFTVSDGPWGYNGELQEYTDSTENCFQDGNGNLVIRATRNPDGTYSSARIHTAGKFSHLYGTWEARIKVNSRHGLWPAWWLMGESFVPDGDWPSCGEIDILDDYGWSTVESTVHIPDESGTGMLDPAEGTYADVPVDGAWHVWQMKWNSYGYGFYKDGMRYLHVNPVKGLTEPAFTILNLAVGGAAGAPEPADFPADLLVDYVRVSAQ